jgi:hypothetical protein
VQEAFVMLSPRAQLPPLTPPSGSSALGRPRSAGLSTPPQVRGQMEERWSMKCC